MNPGIQMLELAIGIKDSLMAAGFTSLDSLLRSSPTELATLLGIEFYVAKIIVDAARRAAGKGDNDEGNGDSMATMPTD
jgi:hypothetical protein